MFGAIMTAFEEIQGLVAFINQIVAEIGKPKFSYPSCEVDHDMFEAVRDFAIEDVKFALDTDDKTVRDERMQVIYNKMYEKFDEIYPDQRM